jgi:nitrogen fixation-related uncharacterized protein
MTGTQRRNRRFGLLAVASLVVGCLMAQALWWASHHRYDDPDSGYYYGSVHGSFSGPDANAYMFHFKGHSEARWHWMYSTHFVYRSLRFGWFRFDERGDQLGNTGTLTLPSFAFESSQGTGVLTRPLLSEWLLGTTNAPPNQMRGVDRIYELLQAAAEGTLPAPRHHTYYFPQPIHGSMQHFRLGLGISWPVYVWFGIWLAGVVFFGRRR